MSRCSRISCVNFHWIDAMPQEKPNDPEAFRLLGEVKFALKDYEGSAAAYRSSVKVCLPRAYLLNANIFCLKPFSIYLLFIVLIFFFPSSCLYIEENIWHWNSFQTHSFVTYRCLKLLILKFFVALPTHCLLLRNQMRFVPRSIRVHFFICILALLPAFMGEVPIWSSISKS